MEDQAKTTSTVKKCMCSFPIGLYRWGQREAKRIAQEHGKSRANFSGFLAMLLFQAKQNDNKKQ